MPSSPANSALGLAAWRTHLSQQTKFIDSAFSTRIEYDAWLASAAAAAVAKEGDPSIRAVALPDAAGVPPLALPAPEDIDRLITLDVSSGKAVVLDQFGPVVVNTDGTLSRITNWPTMTIGEQETAKRLIARRNGNFHARTHAALPRLNLPSFVLSEATPSLSRRRSSARGASVSTRDTEISVRIDWTRKRCSGLSGPTPVA
jgi:hypothetical protein